MLIISIPKPTIPLFKYTTIIYYFRHIWAPAREEAWEPWREAEVAGDTLMESSKSKSRKDTEEKSRKKAKLMSEKGVVWGEYRSEPGVASWQTRR